MKKVVVLLVDGKVENMYFVSEEASKQMRKLNQIKRDILKEEGFENNVVKLELCEIAEPDHESMEDEFENLVEDIKQDIQNCIL